VPEYWIVRLTSRDVLVCAQPDPSRGDDTQVWLAALPEELVSPALPFRAPVVSFAASAPDPTP